MILFSPMHLTIVSMALLALVSHRLKWTTSRVVHVLGFLLFPEQGTECAAPTARGRQPPQLRRVHEEPLPR